MPKQIGQGTYYSLPEAAARLGVSRQTMLRWVTNGLQIGRIKIRVLKDPISKHYYISKDSVAKLSRRFQLI